MIDINSKLNKLADKFLKAGREYRLEANKSGIYGAVIWVSDSKDGLVIYTRGEYREQILENIHKFGTPRMFGTVNKENTND